METEIVIRFLTRRKFAWTRLFPSSPSLRAAATMDTAEMEWRPNATHQQQFHHRKCWKLRLRDALVGEPTMSTTLASVTRYCAWRRIPRFACLRFT